MQVEVLPATGAGSVDDVTGRPVVATPGLAAAHIRLPCRSAAAAVAMELVVDGGVRTRERNGGAWWLAGVPDFLDSPHGPH